MKAKYLFAMLTVVTALYLPRAAQAQSCSNGTCEVWAVYDPTYNTISGYFTYDNYEGFWVLLDAYIYYPNWNPTHLGGAVDEVSAEVDFSYTPAISGNYYLLGVNQYEVEDDYGWTFDGYSSTTVWGGPPPPYISSCTLEGSSWVDGQNTIYCTGQFLTNSVSVSAGGPEGGYFLGSSSATVDGSGDDMTVTVSLGEILYNGAWILITDASSPFTIYLPPIQPWPPASVVIAVQNGFVSMAGNGLVLLGGPGGLTTTTVTATGSPAGGTVAWSAGPRLQVNPANSANANVTGTSPSTAGGDTSVSVQYTVNGQTALAGVGFTVENPTLFQVSGPLGGPESTTVINGAESGYQTTITYYVLDQMDPPNPIPLPGIPATETLSTLSAPQGVTFDPPDGQPKTDVSNGIGQIWDQLYATEPGGLPPNFGASRSQNWTVNGFGFGGQTQTYYLTYAMVQNQSLSRQ